MRRPTVAQLSHWGSGRIDAAETVLRRRIGFVWTDSRKVSRGDVFVAVKTERDDGHNYVAGALDAGAAAAVVDRRTIAAFPPRYRARLIAVNDTVKALQAMGRAYRTELGILIIGITGSNGKTTTRSFMASILGTQFEVGQTYTNWNNHLGVPMSLLRFTGKEWLGIIEMGANHLHEIRTLSRTALPDIGIITNIGYGHIGLFGTLEATTKAKFEITQGLCRDGFLLLNGDDRRLVSHATGTGRTCHFFGTSQRCDIRARDVSLTKDLHTVFRVDRTRFELPVPGVHFVYNVLPSIFLARRFGMQEHQIVEAVAQVKAFDLRGGIVKRAGASIIVDCYNANPSSMAAALDLLGGIAARRNRVAIVGEMLELGRHAAAMHRALGARLRTTGVDRVIAVGEHGAYVKKGAGPSARVWLAADAAQAAGMARDLIKRGDTVLLKGSRGVHLEKVLEELGA